MLGIDRLTGRQTVSDVNPERQRLLDYLTRYHLVPQNMKAREWDEDGFTALNPITGHEYGPVPWPEGFNYDWFCKLAEVADASDARRGLSRSQYKRLVVQREPV